MSITLGFQPERLQVKLSRFSDYAAALIYDDGDPLTVNAWPTGTVIELRFYPNATDETPGATWAATIVDERADWFKDKTDVATDVLDDGNIHARLFYGDASGAELEWALGTVKDVN